MSSILLCLPIPNSEVIVHSIAIGDDPWTLGFEGCGQFDSSSRARLRSRTPHTLKHPTAPEQ